MQRTYDMGSLRRSAPRIAYGVELLDLITKPESIKALVTAADNNVPPLECLGQALKAALPGGTPYSRAAKSMVGKAVTLIMIDNGYVPVKTVRLVMNPVFTTGLLYCKRAVVEATNGNDHVLERMLSGLTATELEIVLALAKKRLKEI